METLCWDCKNALGGCSWAKRNGTPVKGWDAEQTTVKDVDGNYGSYCVKSCPEYVPDNRRIITEVEIAKILGYIPETVHEMSRARVIEEMQTKGYTVKYNWADRLWYEIRR